MPRKNLLSQSFAGLPFLLIFLINFNNPAQAQILLPQTESQISFIPPDSAVIASHTSLASNQYPKFKREAAYITAGAAAWVLTFSIVDEPLQQLSQDNRCKVVNMVASTLEPLGRQRNLAPLAGAALAGGLIMKDKKLQKAGALSLGSIALNAVATSTLKSFFARERPSTTTENHVFDEPFNSPQSTSLPSSHTSTAFAVATTVATVYKDIKLVPPIAYGVATLVGLSRINDNMHWTTDVLAGAAVGYVSARVVNHLYDIAAQKIQAKKTHLYFSPEVGSSSAGMHMTLVF